MTLISCMWRVWNNGKQLLMQRWFIRPKRFVSTGSGGAQITAGDSASIARTFTADDVRRFAEITGDCNPIHVDTDYAKHTKYGRCVVHGALINGLVSAVMGTRLPGSGTVVAHQYLEFPNALYVNEAVEAKVEVTLVKKKLVECSFCCTAIERNTVVMKGYVKLLRMISGSSKLQNPPES